jgi:hypothetical protein
MQHMRRTIREYNIYRWAASLITELTELRLDQQPTPAEHPARTQNPAA